MIQTHDIVSVYNKNQTHVITLDAKGSETRSVIDIQYAGNFILYENTSSTSSLPYLGEVEEENLLSAETCTYDVLTTIKKCHIPFLQDTATKNLTLKALSTAQIINFKIEHSR